MPKMRSHIPALTTSLIVLAALHTISAVPVPVTDSSIASNQQPSISKRQYLDGSGYYLIQFSNKNPVSGEFFYRRSGEQATSSASRGSAHSSDGVSRERQVSDTLQDRQDDGSLDLSLLPETDKDLLSAQDFYSAGYGRSEPAQNQDTEQEARDYNLIDPSLLSFHNAESGEDWYYQEPTAPVTVGRRQDDDGDLLGVGSDDQASGEYWDRDLPSKQENQARQELVGDPDIVTIVPRKGEKDDLVARQDDYYYVSAPALGGTHLDAIGGELWYRHNPERDTEDGKGEARQEVVEDPDIVTVVPRQDGSGYNLAYKAASEALHADAVDGEVWYRDVRERDTQTAP